MVMRGQASTETIMVFAISLTIVLAFMSLALGAMQDSARTQQRNDAYTAAHELAAAADSVYAQGEGASRTVTVRLPQWTNFSTEATYIGKPGSQTANGSFPSRTITINYGFGEASADAGQTVTGSFPSSVGIYKMKVVSLGNRVSIYPALVETGQNSLFASIGQGEISTLSFHIYRISHEEVNATVGSVWGFGGINLSISPATLTPTSGGVQVNVTVSAGDSSAGFYTSAIIVNATSSPSGISEIISIPVSVDVQAG